MSKEKFVCIRGCRVNGQRLSVGDDITVSAKVSADKLQGLLSIGRIAPADSDEARDAKKSVKKAPAPKKAPAAVPAADPGDEG